MTDPNRWWEVNECLQLVSCELSVGEPFQVDHQNFGQPPEIQFLHCLLMLLAAGAIPDKQAQNKVGLNNETNSTLSVWNHSLGHLRRYFAQVTMFCRDILDV
jgi:hypothetical protein